MLSLRNHYGFGTWFRSMTVTLHSTLWCVCGRPNKMLSVHIIDLRWNEGLMNCLMMHIQLWLSKGYQKVCKLRLKELRQRPRLIEMYLFSVACQLSFRCLVIVQRQEIDVLIKYFIVGWSRQIVESVLGHFSACCDKRSGVCNCSFRVRRTCQRQNWWGRRWIRQRVGWSKAIRCKVLPMGFQRQLTFEKENCLRDCRWSVWVGYRNGKARLSCKSENFDRFS